MAVLVDSNTRLMVQGITGSAGAFHTRQCIAYGTQVVAGVTPGKGGQSFEEGVPIFDSVAQAGIGGLSSSALARTTMALA